MNQTSRWPAWLLCLVCLTPPLLAVSPAAAQTTLRIVPNPVIFAPPGRTRRIDVEFWADNIPEPGLGSFRVAVDTRATDNNPLPPCVTFDSATLDPALEAAWQGFTRSRVSTLDQLSTVFWTSWATGSQPQRPTGTVRLGHITFVAREANCSNGEQKEFFLASDVSSWGSLSFLSEDFDNLGTVPWIFGQIRDRDLTVSCQRLSPAGGAPFVDGDFLTQECLVSNLGTGGFSGEEIPLLMSVFSDDTVFELSDTEIVRSGGAGVLGGGQSATVLLSAQPTLRTPGLKNVCNQIDVDLSSFALPWGEFLETDEANNAECSPLEVATPYRDLRVVPGSLGYVPDPADPNGLTRAGLLVEVGYDVQNTGNGAIRFDHRNILRIGTDAASALLDPNSEICGVDTTPVHGLPLVGGATLRQDYGLGTGSGPEPCQIPFTLTPGTYELIVELDANNAVIEEDPNGGPGAAEGNNFSSIPITVSKPLDPQFRVQHKAAEINDQRVEIFGPATGKVIAAVASASGLTSYSFDLNWSPPELLSLGDPALPSGDPSQAVFRTFLEQGGLVQSCSVTSGDRAAGRVSMACTTSDPGGSGAAAWTEKSRPIVDITMTPQLPGEGTFTISNLLAKDGSGQPFANLRVSGGTFIIDGQPELSVLDPVPAPAAWPGVDFAVSYRVLNDGFGEAIPPLLTELIISRDGFNDPQDAFSPDLLACSLAETSPFPGKTDGLRTMIDCLIRENLRPGIYTGFFQVRNNLLPQRRSQAEIPFPSRVLALRKTSNGRRLDLRRHPVQPGDSSGAAEVGTRKFASGSVASVGSEQRNRNWLVSLRRPSGRRGKLLMQQLPVKPNQKADVLRELRVDRRVKRVLAGADIDGDGEEELILLLKSGKAGDALDFRRIDYLPEFPTICPSAALTPVFPERIVSAAGIQADGDPEDELAVLTRDGTLTIYDLNLVGPVPPAVPCLATPGPFILQPPALAELLPLSSDPVFSLQGDEVTSLCALDFDLDGIDEIGSLHRGPGGAQPLRIFTPPAVMGGSVLPVADDEGFGDGGKILAISCTR